MFILHASTDISLELLDPAHAEDLFCLTDTNRLRLRKWFPWVDGVREVEDTQNFIRASQKQWADNSGFQVAIRHEGQLVGVAGHHEVNWTHGSASLGYWLAQAQEGKGIMTEACRVLCRHGFGEMKLNRIEIRCGTENTRSRNIPERLGFKLEGILREAEKVNGRFVDHAVYSMLARAWREDSTS